MKHLNTLLICQLALLGCSGSDELCDCRQECFWEFYHVVEKVDRYNEHLIYRLDKSQPLTAEEVDSLKIILNRLNKKYYVTETGKVLVSRKTVPTVSNMAIIDAELFDMLNPAARSMQE
ncbi:MAG: hypothetical protein RIC19_01050 [Phaeodactylibacter sp.]|uniref:hypothetical protein n=1 Tax=Phaeodactylibacter sp. TaxID=1940289 RepID=UPI0032ED85A7